MNVELTAKTGRTDWKSGKEQELWDYVQQRLAQGCPVGLAIKEFAEKHHIKWLTARHRYYKFNRSRDGVGSPAGDEEFPAEADFSDEAEFPARPARPNNSARRARSDHSDRVDVWDPSDDEGTGAPSTDTVFSDRPGDELTRTDTPGAESPKEGTVRSLRRGRRPRIRKDSDEILDDIAGFLKNASALPSLNLAGLLKGLHSLAELASDGLEVARAREELAARRGEVEGLKGEITALKEEVAGFKNRLAGLREQCETLNFLVNDWFNLQSVDKVTSLGDFGRRLKYQVDQFGSVVKVLMK